MLIQSAYRHEADRSTGLVSKLYSVQEERQVLMTRSRALFSDSTKHLLLVLFSASFNQNSYSCKPITECEIHRR